MNKILISRCLLGEKVRYDGKGNFCDHPLIQQWLSENRLIAICPEMAGGLSTPRDPAEIVGAGGGAAVLQNLARIKTRHNDVTDAYVRGAELALALAQQHQIKFALLKANSPSCGNLNIYDGSFSGQKIAGEGVTAALLLQNNILVFNESQIELLASHLNG